MKAIRVTFDNGNSLETNINGTDEEIRSYYLGQTFNLGCEDDVLAIAVAVEVLP